MGGIVPIIAGGVGIASAHSDRQKQKKLATRDKRLREDAEKQRAAREAAAGRERNKAQQAALKQMRARVGGGFFDYASDKSSTLG